MDDIEKRMEDFEERLDVMSNWFGRVKEAVLNMGGPEHLVRTMDEIAVYTNIDAMNRRMDRIESEMGRAFAVVNPDTVNFALSHMLEVVRLMHRRLQEVEGVPEEEKVTFEEWVAKNVMKGHSCAKCKKRGGCTAEEFADKLAMIFENVPKGEAN